MYFEYIERVLTARFKIKTSRRNSTRCPIILIATSQTGRVKLNPYVNWNNDVLKFCNMFKAKYNIDKIYSPFFRGKWPSESVSFISYKLQINTLSTCIFSTFPNDLHVIFIFVHIR